MNPILIDLPEEIKTPRLVLRHLKPGDGPMLNEVVCQEIEHLRPWLPWARQAPTVEESEEHCRRSYARWILREDLGILVLERETGRLLGGSGLHRISWEVPRFEIGYWLRKDAEGRGLMTEAALALTHFAFLSFAAKRVEIRCEVENRRSAAIPERLGYRPEGVLRHQLIGTDGTPKDMAVYARTDSVGLPDLDISW